MSVRPHVSGASPDRAHRTSEGGDDHVDPFDPLDPVDPLDPAATTFAPHKETEPYGIDSQELQGSQQAQVVQKASA
jgi:hypothetical protein